MILLPSTSGAGLAKPVHLALQQIGKQSNPASTLTRLLIYEQVCARPSRSGRRQPASVRLFLRRCLREFRHERPKDAALLEQRYFDEDTVKEIAHARLVSQETINRNQHSALKLFADWLHEQEAAAWAELQNSLLASLPPASYSKLFGQRAQRSALNRQLRSQGAPWVIGLTGIGGIGKTSLVHGAVRGLIPSLRYKRLICLQATDDLQLDEGRLLGSLARRLVPISTPASRQLAALQQALKAVPTLIVLDNLDSEVENSGWVDRLHSLSNPSKFVICSRRRPAALSRAYSLTLGELDQKTAGAFIQHQAAQLGLERAQGALQRSTAAIYARTGGNPLALKLVAGLLHALPLGNHPEQLRRTQTGCEPDLRQHLSSELERIEQGRQADTAGHATGKRGRSRLGTVEGHQRVIRGPPAECSQ